MSLCTQSVRSFSFPARPLRTAPLRFPKTIRFGSRRSVGGLVSRAQRRLNALAPGYLKGTVVRGHPAVWSLALRPDDAKQDPVVYGAELGIVFLAEGSRPVFIQGGLDCLGLYHSGLEGERYFWLIVELL